MKKRLIFAFVLLPIIGMAQKPGYYNGTEGKSGEDLKTALHNIIDQHVDFSYSDAKYILLNADSDPSNLNNVILFYTKRSQDNDTWGTGGNFINREHVWAKSHGNFEDRRPMDGDAFNLHAADGSVNVLRSNYDFDDCSTNGTYIDEADAYYESSAYKFEPSDLAKGEVARTIFYMATRYEGTDGELDLEVVDAVNTSAGPEHGKLSTLLQWNNDFPPTDFERRRNEKVYESQRNRNPFIDNPEFINLIWGGTTASTILIGDLALSEPFPQAGSTVQLSSVITGNTSAIFYHSSIWDGETNSNPMSGSGNNWTANFDLSSYSAGDLVYYKIVASDGITSQTLRGTYSIPVNKTLTPISSAQGTGTTTPLSGSTISVGGIITANFDNVYNIQTGKDPRNGMTVYGILRGHIGDSIVVTGRITEYSTLTEIDNVSYSYVYSSDNDIQIPEIIISQANEDYESMLVTFKGVTFLEGDTKLAIDAATTIHFTDGTNTMPVYVRYNSRLGGKTVPSGTVDVTGIVSQFNGTYQILINSIDYISVGEDNDPPLLTGVVVNDASWIEVSFSEKIDKTTAENVSNYSITGGNVTINGAYLYNGTKVQLLTTGLQKTNYTLTVSNVADLQNNVMNQTSKEFSSDFGNYVGIEEIKSSFKIYPNPTTNLLNISFEGKVALNGRLQITDIKGKTLLEINDLTFGQTLSVPVENLAEGFYFIRLINNEGIINRKFIIKR
jgi:endonuclease I